MKLTDIMPLEKWVKLEKDIHGRSGLDVNVFNADGIRISDFKKWANRLCPAIKDTDKGQSFICAVAHMNLAAQAKKTNQPVIEECDAGFLKMVVPIVAEEEFVGAVGACGFLLDEGEVDTFAVNKITEIDEDTIERLSDGLKSISTDKVEALASYITEEINMIIADYDNKSA